MAIEKKSLIGNRATVKKAVLASVSGSPAKIGKVVDAKAGKIGRFHFTDARRGKIGRFVQG